jgi:glycosyltransferase involved in cell wall biosynthesis
LNLVYLTSVHLDEASAPSHHVLNTCKAMAALGQRVTLVHPGPPIAPLWRHTGIREKRLPYPRVKGGWRLFERLAAWKIQRLASLGKHDVIYMRFSPSLAVSRALKQIELPKILELNGSEVLDARDFRPLADSVDMLLVDSEKMATLVRNRLPQVAGKVRIHACVGVDTSHFGPLNRLDCRNHLRIPESRHVMLHVSGFQAHHDFATIFKAAEFLAERDRQFVLFLLGNGPRWSEIKKLAAGLRCAQSIVMPGAVPLSTLPLYIGAANICLNVVTARALGEGNFRATKLFEYMACERPVISTISVDETVPKWAIDYLSMISPENPGALAESIEGLSDRIDEIAGRLACGRQWVESHMSWTAGTRTTLSHLSAFNAIPQ